MFEPGPKVTNYQAPIYVQVVQDDDSIYSNYQNVLLPPGAKDYSSSSTLEQSNSLIKSPGSSHVAGQSDWTPLYPADSFIPSSTYSEVSTETPISSESEYSLPPGNSFDFNFPLYYPQFQFVGEHEPASKPLPSSDRAPVYYSTANHDSGKEQSLIF